MFTFASPSPYVTLIVFFSEMKFNIWMPGSAKFYCYSDHPHLRRSSYFEKFGRYAEGMHGDRMEYRMMISFLQNKGKGLFYDDYQSLVNHDFSMDDRVMPRSLWMKFRRGDNFFLNFLRNIYRNIKFNTDYFFMNAKY